jgi:heme A synthase
VGIFTLVLLVMVLRTRERQLFRLGVAAAALVVFQGVLGGLTVLYKLPRPISIAHLATSMCFFSLTVLIALRTAPSLPSVVREERWMEGGRPLRATLRPWFAAAWGLLLAQIVLGGLVRHTASGLACLDVPLCHGVPWPDKAPEQVQMIHRAGAIVSGTAIILLAVRQWRIARGIRWLRRLSLLPIALVAVQLGLGMASVLSLLDLTVITAHLAVAAALLGALVVLFEVSPRARPSPESNALAQGSSDAVAVP